jgi:hypothetical protein
MSDAAGPEEVPDGAAVFPEIPADLGVHPLLLAVLHATVFLAGSDNKVVHPAAADEAIQAMAGYLQRLDGTQLAQVREDLDCLIAFARQSKWHRELVLFLKGFLSDYGIGGEDENE